MSTAASLSHAREWGETYGFPVVVYEWLGKLDVCELSLWAEINAYLMRLRGRQLSLPVHALVWKDGFAPLKLLEEAT